MLRVGSLETCQRWLVGVWLLVLVCSGVTAARAQGTRDDYARSASLDRWNSHRVYRTRIEPQWMPGEPRFRYRVEIGRGKFETVWVDAERGERRVETDQERGDRSSGELQPLTFEQRSGDNGAESAITFVNEWSEAVEIFWVTREGGERSYGELPAGDRRQQHTFAGHVWRVADKRGGTRAWFVAENSPALAKIGERSVIPRPARAAGRDRRGRGGDGGGRSPDLRWRVVVEQHNLLLEPLNDGVSADAGKSSAAKPQLGERVPLTNDGSAADFYAGPIVWAPSGKHFVAWQTKAVESRKVHLIESSPKDQTQPKLHSFDYAKPGDPLPQRRPRLFAVEQRRATPLDDSLVENSWSVEDIRWRPDSQEFTFVYHQRGHQLTRVQAVHAETGVARLVIEERAKTFFDYAHKQFLHWLDKTNEAIWMSEREGWNHLYLYDAATGQVKNPITRGSWVVRGVERVDEERRQVWLRVSGCRAEEDPYHVHLARVDFAGENFTVLTAGDGMHQWKFSPDGRYLVDTWSRVDQPPVTELRSAEDGRLIVELERGDASELWEAGWRPPERFVAKGRDGLTDIHGIVIRPTNFDPARKWPVIEHIYAGPQSAFTPKEWSLQLGLRQLAELGFVVVQMDGMGTSHRSKAFHDVCHTNLGDAGFPDRIAWIKALGAKYPELDLQRVGIYGGSAGGQNALRAVLAHGDFYRAAAADCGCHDNRMDKVWWNELWMGWPLGPHYAEQSNVTQAHRLSGELLLIVGELDRNVDPASTMQVVDALVRADKDFELLIIPGAGHGAAESPYGKRRRMDFFVRKLLGKEPRNEGGRVKEEGGRVKSEG